MSLFKNASLCCVSLLAAAACSSGHHGVDLDWQVVAQGQPEAAYLGIPGATVCVQERPEIACATTDADGLFALKSLPLNTELVLTVEKDGYIPSLKPIKTNDGTAGPVVQPVVSLVAQPIVMFKAADLPNNLGFPVDTTGSGIIDFFVFTFQGAGDSNPGPLPGVKVELTPATEKAAVYFSAPGVFDSTLQATVSFGGTFGLGNLTSGHFFNVPEGEYTVNFTAPAGFTCASLTSPLSAWGIPVSGGSAVRVPVRAGYNTANIGMHCQR